MPKPDRIAISSAARERPVASASAADAPAAVSSTVAELKIVATAATTTDPPMYRAMFEIPDACPTWSCDTAAVDADDAGPFARPSPADSATSGRTRLAYVQEDSTSANAPNPTAPRPKPATMASLVPMRAASGVINGVTAIMAPAGKRRYARLQRAQPEGRRILEVET